MKPRNLNRSLRLSLAAVGLIGSFALAGCESGEELADDVGDAAEEVADGVEDAVDELD